jgi:hypothetical protein
MSLGGTCTSLNLVDIINKAIMGYDYLLLLLLLIITYSAN